MPINPYEWQIKDKDSKTNESPDEIVINKPNSLENLLNYLTPYQTAINILSDILKDKIGAGLSKDESIIEFMATLERDIKISIDLKKGKD